jgi:hypothetical protein
VSQPIFTLEARGNIMLAVLQGYFDLNRAQMPPEINASFSQLLEILRVKRIDYASLKSVLIPNPDRKEAAFTFDTTQINSGRYGFEVAEWILPARLSCLCFRSRANYCRGAAAHRAAASRTTWQGQSTYK